MVSLLNNLCRLPVLVALILIQMLVLGGIGVSLAELQAVTGGNGILDFEIGYSGGRVREILGSYGPDGFAIYNRIQFLDIANPALYSLLLLAMAWWIWKPTGRVWPALIPSVAGIGDYLENIALAIIVQAYPDTPAFLIQTANVLSLLKYGLMFCVVVSLAAGLIARASANRTRVSDSQEG
jgi:hypothetical protein